jgi:heterodisulfide reductase subunit C
MATDFQKRSEIVAEIPGLLKCFQCGTCVSSCPATIYSGHFSPRGFILECLKGMQSKALGDDLWRCLTCNNCNERCPQGVNPYDVIVKLKAIAIREKLLSPEKLKEKEEIFTLVADTGIAYHVSELAKKKRRELGLPEIKQGKML